MQKDWLAEALRAYETRGEKGKKLGAQRQRRQGKKLGPRQQRGK
jgi:hypothetical protein